MVGGIDYCTSEKCIHNISTAMTFAACRLIQLREFTRSSIASGEERPRVYAMVLRSQIF